MEDIKDYYIIGDLHSAALVSKNASIDWLCLPHFDSPSIFAKLLDNKGGSFSVDNAEYSVSSGYVENSAIVEFNFKNKHSEFILRDFMVPQASNKCENHFLVRKFIAKLGKSKVKILFNPKPVYAKSNQELNFNSRLDLEMSLGKDSILLYPPSSSIIRKTKEGYQLTFTLVQGEEASVVMEYIVTGHKPIYEQSSPTNGDQNTENQTKKFWNDWVSKGTFFDFCKGNLIRSAIALKLMQFYPTGAIVASPTTSLPEVIGGERNWDYRYVWIRDATLTLYALYVLGYEEEAEKFFEFIQSIVKKCGKEDFDVSLMYTIDGNSVPEEKILEHLSGFKNSKPVRVGNGAKAQFQLDVYGSLIDAYYFASKRQLELKDPHKNLILSLVKKIKETWLKKDNGIWEVRSGRQHFTYSKVMAWVGVNRTLRMSKQLDLKDKEKKECQVLEKQISDWIWQNCFDPANKTFRQYPESTKQDATNLYK